MSRLARVESLLKQEISRIIHQEFRSNLGIISIIQIKIAKDLANATVFYSHYGSNQDRKKTLEKLNKAAYFIKGKLGKFIRLKRIPTLIFRLDNSLEIGTNIIEKMNSL